jgi:DNA-directed RNA polymerase subunit RPC12/RpoP
MQQKYQCPNCGAPVSFGTRFCGRCGIQLNWPAQQLPPNPSPYQQQPQNYSHLRCPQCKKRGTLQFNSINGLYECRRCRRKFTVSEIANKRAPVSPKADHKSGKAKRYKSKTQINAKDIFRTIEKILIFAAIIVITAIVVTSVCMFISNTLQVYALIAILVLGLVFLSLCLHSFARRRLTFTRFFLVFLFSFIFIILSSSYLDLRTPNDIKNNISTAFSIPKGQFRENMDLIVQRTQLKTIEMNNTGNESTVPVITPPQETIPPQQAIPSSPGPNTQKSSENYVLVNGAILVGADGHCITLKNNPDASDPSWEQLKSFLLKDDTDQIPYDFDKFVCADFAERLHNNAELAGIRAAYVCVDLGPSSYYSLSGGHALNAFQTTDRGIVYIDCTGFQFGISADKIVDVVVGNDYVPQSIFPQPGWSSVWSDMGKIEGIDTVQW